MYGKALQEPLPMAALPPAPGDDAVDDADVEPPSKLPGKPAPALAGKPGKPDAAKPAKPGTVMASAQPDPSLPMAGRRFTLQMKAFAKPEDAEAFAAPLRSNGHDVRVEAHEIKGRIWHRVRMGEFDTWEEGLTAKSEFEKGEKTIAYVVRL